MLILSDKTYESHDQSEESPKQNITSSKRIIAILEAQAQQKQQAKKKPKPKLEAVEIEKLDKDLEQDKPNAEIEMIDSPSEKLVVEKRDCPLSKPPMHSNRSGSNKSNSISINQVLKYAFPQLLG